MAILNRTDYVLQTRTDYMLVTDNELTVESEILINKILERIDKRLTRALSWVYSKEEGSKPSLL